MRRWTLMVLPALVAAVAVSCSSSRSRAAPPTSRGDSTTTSSTLAKQAIVPVTIPGPCNPVQQPHHTEQTLVTMQYAGARRDYLLYVPAAYDGVRPVAVVFDFHGYGSSAMSQVFYSDFRPIAEREDFLVVAPDGQGSGPNRHFNVTGERGLADDVGFTLAVLDQVEAKFCVDGLRVYAAGMSNGGAMSALLSCRAANRFAAFGVVALVQYPSGCAPGRPVSIAAFSGTNDPVVPYYGGTIRCCGYPTIAPAATSISRWASLDGCSGGWTERSLSSLVLLRRWSGCSSGSEVRFYIIEGGGHTWPGTFTVPYVGATSKQISAAETLWTFFQAHPQPP